MNCEGTDALEQALALRAAPAHAPMLRGRPLPAAVLTLLELAAGRRETVDACARRTSESPSVLAEAAILFIQQVMFDEAADHYRVLGVSADAPVETIHEHHRWLMRWLHPDRGGERWETAFSDRVNAAWNVLRAPQRRAEYDAWLAACPPARPRLARVMVPATLVSRPAPLLSSQAVRQVPALALAGLVVIGGAAALWMSGTNSPPRSRAMAVLQERDAAPPPRDIEGEAARRALGEDEDDVELAPAEPSNRLPTMAASGHDDAPGTPIDAGATESAATAAVVASAATEPPAGGESAMPPIIAAATEARPPALAGVVSPVAVAGVQAVPNAVGSGRGHGNDVRAVASGGPPSQAPTRTQPAMEALTPRRAPTGGAVPPAIVVARATAADDGTSRPGHMQNSVGDARVLPAPAMTRVEPSSGAVTTATRDALTPAYAAAASLPRAFADSYARGDLAAMMALFAPDARENRDDRLAIAGNYRRLFNTTAARDVDLAALDWTVRADRIVGQGRFVVRLRPSGSTGMTRVQGWIRIEASARSGWKIERLLHGNDR